MEAEKRYTITLTAGQIEEIRNAREDGATLNDDTLAALDAAKPIRTPKKAAAPIDDEPLIPTGDAALDTFIETHHRPDWRDRLVHALKNRPGMMRMPAALKGHDAVALKPHERAHLYEAFNVREARVSA